MVKTLEDAFSTMKMEGPNGDLVDLNSHTSKEQGLFIQDLMHKIKPQRSLEIGLAYGISTLFILEKHREFNNIPKSHLVIEPFPWGGVAEHNINKENLSDYIDIRYLKSDQVLPKLYDENHRIQLAYIDTTKVFDTVLQDFYFIDKILDVGGVIILDDCGGVWPGVQRVARFINSLPHYKVIKKHNKNKITNKKRIAISVVKILVSFIPFKEILYPTIDFRSDYELGLDYSCIAFQKVGSDRRNWDFDITF